MAEKENNLHRNWRNYAENDAYFFKTIQNQFLSCIKEYSYNQTLAGINNHIVGPYYSISSDKAKYFN